MGSAYMYGTLEKCYTQLSSVKDELSKNPIQNGPIIFGVFGSGLVGQRAVDTLKQLGAQEIKSLDDTANLDPTK